MIRSFILWFFLVFLCAGFVHAQTNSTANFIEDTIYAFPDFEDGDTIATCTGFFSDSSKDTTETYGYENYSVTFCSKEDNNYLSMEFLFFDLGESDFMLIYDGDDDEPIYDVEGNDLHGEKIMGSSECLQFEFTSTPNEHSYGWMAEIDCFELCDAFEVSVTANGDESLDFCPGVGIVQFVAEAEYIGGDPEDYTDDLEFEWNFDGEVKEGKTVTHDYTDKKSGAYPFKLTVTDNINNCDTTLTKTVRIATEPDLIVDGPREPVCAEEIFNLFGYAEPNTWTGFDVRVETEDFINPDNPFSSKLDFDVFSDDDEITEVEDFNKVCIKIEHEDFGHLEFNFECPDGSSVQLKDISPGGAHLGEPVVGNDEIPGTGYEYCFSTSPEYGTMAEKSFEYYEYTDQTGNYYANEAYLPPGTYTPNEDFENLVGCPLNGEWKFTATDLNDDNAGHVKGWSIFFDEDFYADSLIFTPEIVEKQWYDDNDNPINNGGNVYHSEEEEGFYDYAFVTIDDFGCEWSDTITVEILPLPEAEIIPYTPNADYVTEIEMPFCEGDSTLLRVEPAYDDWEYQWYLNERKLENRIHDTIMAKGEEIGGLGLGNYIVEITDPETGCIAEIEKEVNDKNCDLRIPNVFTPPNPPNAEFEIEQIEGDIRWENMHMIIYNRWGDIVYEHTDYFGNWWDGAGAPDGVYYYVLTYQRKQLGYKKRTQGVVHIIR